MLYAVALNTNIIFLFNKNFCELFLNQRFLLISCFHKYNRHFIDRTYTDNFRYTGKYVALISTM